jgi:glyoxylase I family protein
MRRGSHGFAVVVLRFGPEATVSSHFDCRLSLVPFPPPRRLIDTLPDIERVTGIGGFFFRARDPAALAIWYQERLGVKTVPETYEEMPWRQQEGETAFAPFPQDSEMIGPPEHTWMINFRVEDLDAMVEQLRAAREPVEVDPVRYPNGRFAALRDPEGNGIQLWQPMRPE